MSEQIKIKPEIVSLKDRLLPLMRERRKDNHIAGEDVAKIIATEDGHDVDAWKKSDDYRSNLIAGTYLAQGELSKEVMLKDKDITNLTGNYELGNNKLEIEISRHKRVPNRIMDKDSGLFKVDGEKDLYGSGSVKYIARGAVNSAGDLKAVRSFVESDFAMSSKAFQS